MNGNKAFIINSQKIKNKKNAKRKNLSSEGTKKKKIQPFFYKKK